MLWRYRLCIASSKDVLQLPNIFFTLINIINTTWNEIQLFLAWTLGNPCNFPLLCSLQSPPGSASFFTLSVAIISSLNAYFLTSVFVCSPLAPRPKHKNLELNQCHHKISKPPVGYQLPKCYQQSCRHDPKTKNFDHASSGFKILSRVSLIRWFPLYLELASFSVGLSYEMFVFASTKRVLQSYFVLCLLESNYQAVLAFAFFVAFVYFLRAAALSTELKWKKQRTPDFRPSEDAKWKK